MDLSAYINFSVVLDYSLSAPKLKLVDTSSYPGGVASGISGKVEILQPDGVSTSGAFTDVVYSSGALTIAEKELRLATNSQPQNGSYQISYTVRHADYDDTVLTRTFVLSCTEPTGGVTAGFDVFTPVLQAVDSTSYAHTGMTFQSVSRSWLAVIDEVDNLLGGDNANFDLAYEGDYYDTDYTITLTAIATWTLTSYSWVTLRDKIVTTLSASAEAPPSLEDLLDSLTEYKSELDSLVNTCREYATKKANYLYASSMYEHIIRRGQSNDLSGLVDYVLELQRVLNDNITPSYTHTYEPIPSYDWGAGAASSVAWNNITGKPQPTVIYETVAISGGTLNNGEATWTDSRFANSVVVLFRNNIPLKNSNPGGGAAYFTKASLSANSINLSPALSTGDEIIALLIHV